MIPPYDVHCFKDMNEVYSLTHFPMLASLWEVHQSSIVTTMLCSKRVKTIWLKTIYLIICFESTGWLDGSADLDQVCVIWASLTHVYAVSPYVG